MESTDVIAALAALAQETRLAIFRRLVQAGPEGLPAGQLAEELGAPAPTLSFHLSQLANAGLLTSRRVSRFVYYAADYARMQTLLDFLTENCCGGACAPTPSPPSNQAAVDCCQPESTLVPLGRPKEP
jgi:DNA-binding transcriptional ArsR family regulator